MKTHPFHLLAKPTGAACNLACKYCYYSSKSELYPNSNFRMSDEILESYIRQYIDSQPGPVVEFAWQGGEPTLMGLDFYRRAVALTEQYKKPGMRIRHTIQTNGTRLDDEWCAFFKAHNFLVGISIDGPRELHDAYRVNKGGKGTFNRVMQGLEMLKFYDVDFNILCSVHAANGDYPLDVYRFFRDELNAKYIQFIPIVERIREQVTDRSVKAVQYGEFLTAVFGEWFMQQDDIPKGDDMGHVSVQIIDVALGALAEQPDGLCVFSPTCGNALAIEHNGDVFSCDHFVDKAHWHYLGDINRMTLTAMAASDEQRKFGRNKLYTLPQYCLDCDVRFICHGGCPKNRFINTPSGDAGLNYLCDGYKMFFGHISGIIQQIVTSLPQKEATG